MRIVVVLSALLLALPAAAQGVVRPREGISPARLLLMLRTADPAARAEAAERLFASDHSGRAGLIAAICDPRHPVRQDLVGVTSEPLPEGGERVVVSVTPGFRWRGPWVEQLLDYWDLRCIESQQIAVRTGELMEQLITHRKTRAACLARTLWREPRRGFRRAAYNRLATLLGHRNGYDWRLLTKGRDRAWPGAVCGVPNKRWVEEYRELARKHEVARPLR